VKDDALTKPALPSVTETAQYWRKKERESLARSTANRWRQGTPRPSSTNTEHNGFSVFRRFSQNC